MSLRKNRDILQGIVEGFMHFFKDIKVQICFNIFFPE